MNILSNLHFTQQLVAQLKTAAYMSAFITVLFILIEVPIMIFYIVARYLITLLFVLIGMASANLIMLAWDKLTTTVEQPSTKEA